MKLQLIALVCITLVMITAVGCFEWTEDSQGNLKSVGVPGIPIWKAQTPEANSQPPTVDSGNAAMAINPEEAQLEPASSVPAQAWLDRLNHYRTMAGLPPVGQNLALNSDCGAHASYLVQQMPTDQKELLIYRHSMGPEAHHEDMSSVYYSAAGAECAQGGKRVPNVLRAGDIAFGRDPVDDIDALLEGPFHRLSLIAPWATVAGYGAAGDFPRRAGALVLRGPYSPSSSLVKFPSDGSVVDAGYFRAREFPDPIASCPGYKLPVGLPISVQAGQGHHLKLVSYSLAGPNGAVKVCGFDAASYEGTNPSMTEYGRHLLENFGAAVIVPGQPLADGEYSAIVTTAKHDLKWRFTVRNQSSPPLSAHPRAEEAERGSE